MPTAMPLTTPVPEPTVATAVLLLLHEPPGVPSIREVVKPTHTVDNPVIAIGAGFTVISFVA